jgi:IS5 family transposase
MIGKQPRNTDQVQCVSTETLVPPKHVLRRLHAALDLSFVRELVAPFYAEIGRLSIDPEVVARLWILQHYYGFSEREVCDEVTMHAGFRWFCGLSFADPVPDQSTLVKLRTVKWAASGLWEALLDETVRACEAAGIARGKRMGIDGTQINANAAIVSLEAIPPVLTVVGEASVAEERGEDAVTPIHVLFAASGDAGPMVSEASAPQAALPAPPQPDPAPDAGEAGAPAVPAAPAGPVRSVEDGGRPRGSHRSGDPDWHGEHFSNATHRSTTDPEARLYRKSNGQEAKLRFLGHYMADLPSGVIYAAMATPATGTAEREAALAMVGQMKRKPKQAAMDLGYRDGAFLVAMRAMGVQPLVPLGEEALEEEPTWQRGTNNAQQYQQRQQLLAEVRARNATRLAARGRQGVVAQRQRTRLEHLIGEGKEHHGLDRADGRGVERLDQQIKLTAVVQNLKRLLCVLTRRRRGSPVPEPVQDAAVLDLRGRVAEQTPPSPLPGVSRRIRETLGAAGSAYRSPWTGRSDRASRGGQAASKPLLPGSVASKTCYLTITHQSLPSPAWFHQVIRSLSKRFSSRF